MARPPRQVGTPGSPPGTLGLAAPPGRAPQAPHQAPWAQDSAGVRRGASPLASQHPGPLAGPPPPGPLYQCSRSPPPLRWGCVSQ